jgi:hypothetical protein
MRWLLWTLAGAVVIAAVAVATGLFVLIHASRWVAAATAAIRRARGSRRAVAL